MLKKFTIATFVISVVLFTISVSLIPFYAKGEIYKIFEMIEVYHKNGTEQFNLTDVEDIVFKTNDFSRITLNTRKGIEDITINYDVNTLGDIKFDTHVSDGTMYIDQTTEYGQHATMTFEKLFNFSYDIDLIIPERVKVSFEGESYATDNTYSIFSDFAKELIEILPINENIKLEEPTFLVSDESQYEYSLSEELEELEEDLKE